MMSATRIANAMCSDGIAATGFEPSLCAWARVCLTLPRCNQIQPRADSRATGALSPSRAASHGGASGKRQ